MKKTVTVVLIMLVGCLVFTACGSDTGGEPRGGKSITVASKIEDGATKYNPQQRLCPVCGKAIKPKHHVDVNGKRLYFDREKCVKKFEQNRSQYISE